MLKLDKVSKQFRMGAFGSRALAAVRQVSFEIRPGEVTSLIGESGSGKSTLGKMILRLLTATSGSITFQGTDISTLRGRHLKEYYREVQGVFQDPFSSYNPIFRADRALTVIRNEYFSDLSHAEWQKKMNSSLEAVGLNPPDVLNKFTHQLSGGQLQRILIARALLLDIKVLVADEIISMLDASTRVDVLNVLADLKLRGLGVLFITHDLSLGNYISERTIILRRGTVVEMGATDKVFGNPHHSYTKVLLASVPQLHSKWEPLAETSDPTSATAPTHGAPVPVTGGISEVNGSKRYSKSSIHPLSSGKPDPSISAEEIARRALRQKNDAYLRAHEEIPELLQVEEDHFVAASSVAD